MTPASDPTRAGASLAPADDDTKHAAQHNANGHPPEQYTDTEQSQASSAPAAETVNAKGQKKPLPEIPIAERAHINSQDDLDRVLKAHALWVQDVLNPAVDVAAGRANLEGADLRAYDLAGVNLSGASLAGAILSSCDLTNANLMAANLKGAQMQDCKLRGAKLTRARVDGTDLRGADLTDATLTGVDLSKALLKSPAREESIDPPSTASDAVNLASQGSQDVQSNESASLCSPTSDQDVTSPSAEAL